MKLLILGVSCANDFCDDRPQTCVMCLDDEGIARIRTLAASAKSLDVYSIKEFNYAPTWLNDYVDLEGDTPLDEPSARKLIDELAPSEAAVEIPMLCVTKDSFRFEAVPKHGSASSALATPMVSLSELDNHTPLLLSN